MKVSEIEKRLLVLENAVARLSQGRGTIVRRHPVQVLERIHGVFEDDDAFREAMRLGRKWRRSQCPSPSKPKAKRR